MEDYLDKNLSLIRRRFPDLLAGISGMTDGGNLRTVTAKNGHPVPEIIREGRTLYVHSRFDPQKEAERFVAEVDPARYDLFIVMGFGFGYHAEELLKGAGRNSSILVMEKDPGMVLEAFRARDMSFLLRDERFSLLLSPSEEILIRAFRGKSSYRVSFLVHRGSFQIYPEYYSNLRGMIKSYLSTKEVNIATLAKFEKSWGANIARNIRRIIQCPGVNVFYDRFREMPAIVACAGPSLGKSLEFIGDNRDRAVIIAVDTAYRLLVRQGIEPHFCVTVDPQVINARYFEGSPQSRTVLVADPTSHPSVFRLFRGRCVMTGMAFEMMKWIERIAGEKGEMAYGGSVSTNAYDFARRLGVSSVMLAGQDLAFTGGYAHARGSYLDEQVHLRTGRFYTPEMFNRYQLTALPKIFIRGIRSDRVHTNQKMMIFLNWFEKRNDPHLINITYDGAFMPGLSHASQESLDLSALKKRPDELIDELYGATTIEAGGTEGTIEKMRETLRRMREDYDTLIPALQRSVSLSEDMAALLKGARSDQGRLDYILKKLAETDRLIESRESIKDIIGFTAQRVIHTITEGYEIDEEESRLSEEERVARRSLFLYRGLLDGCRFNIRLTDRMMALLDQGDTAF